MSEPKLVIATNNPGKVAEFRDLLAGCGWQVLSPADAGVAIEVDENGSTYAENARIKAQAFCEATGLPAIADDSGLEVDALDGEPGPLHHVKGWDGEDNDERIQILMASLQSVPAEKRTGRFKSVIVVAMPDGREIEEQGLVEGAIAFEPSGSYGWGYDPVFLLPGRGITMAELPDMEKNRISHRGIAFAKIRDRLRKLSAG